MKSFNITKIARNKLKEFKSKDCFIRIGIKSGGCDGLQYVIDLDSKKIKKSDIEIKYEEITIYIDSKSQTYLREVMLDYKKSLMYTGFEFINPKTKSKCGCGKSFSI